MTTNSNAYQAYEGVDDDLPWWTWAVLSVPFTIYHGWTISIFWGWFVVPFGIMALSVPHAIGLATLILYVRAKLPSKPEPHWSERIAFALVHPLFALGIGWITKQFM